MTNKKFKMAAMSLALTACVAASPLAANAESPETASDAAQPSAVQNESEPEASDAAAEPTDEKEEPSSVQEQEPAMLTVEEAEAPAAALPAREETAEDTPEGTPKTEPTEDAKAEPAQPAEEASAVLPAAPEEKPVVIVMPAEEEPEEKADEDKASNEKEPETPADDQGEDEAKDEAPAAEPADGVPVVPPAAPEEKPVVIVMPAEDQPEEKADEDKPSDEKEPEDQSDEDKASESEKKADEDKDEAPAAEPADSTVISNPEQPSIQLPMMPTIAAGENAGAAAEDPYGISTLMPTGNAIALVDDKVATVKNEKGEITGQYNNFDDAVDASESGSTIEVTKDTTSNGMTLVNKNLTIKGSDQTIVKTNDDSTEEKPTVKPKLKFTKDGIWLDNSNLMFKNLDVDMTGIISTPDGDHPRWMGICLTKNSSLTLDSTDMVMDASGASDHQAIYFAGNDGNALNILNGSSLSISGYLNAIAWNGTKENPKSSYEINIKDSSLTLDRNGAGIVGLESLDVLMDNSTVTITNCTERSGINGANVKIVNGSTVNISDNHEGYGIHANDLLIEDSTVTTNNNGYGGIRITGKGQFTDSTVTVSGTEDKGNAAIEITSVKNEHGTEILNGSLEVKNSILNVSNNNATGIACRNSKVTLNKNKPNEKIYYISSNLTIDNASRVTIQNNHATPKNSYNTKGDIGGGLRIEEGSTAKLGRNTIINNNHADKAGDDIFIMPGGSLTFSVYNGTGDGDLLNDDGCGDKIDGWYIDAEGRRWDFHGDQNYVENILNGTITLPDGVTLVDNGDGTYTITVAEDAAEGLALKAAHAELPVTPDPDDPDPIIPDVPTPVIPEENTPVLPENPELPPVQDAQPDVDAETPVLPENPVLPAVQDAHALPQTGTSLFAALAMALSGIAMMAAGAWASLTGKHARH